MNDYSTIFSEQQIEKAPVNITGGRFSRDNFNKNIQKYSLETLRNEVDHKPLWLMTWKEEDFSEDNDTDDEESHEKYDLEDEDFLRHLQLE